MHGRADALVEGGLCFIFPASPLLTGDSSRNAHLFSALTELDMSSNLQALIHVRSQKVAQVLGYLNDMAAEAAQLPDYFPEHLRREEGEKLPFEDIRQDLRVIEERGHPGQAHIQEQGQTDGEEKERTPEKIDWDHQVVSRYPRLVVLGHPGYGKSWLLRREVRRWALQEAGKLREQRIGLDDLTLPIWVHLSELAQYQTVKDGLEQRVVRKQRALLLPWVLEKLKGERCLLLLDAWDEVGQGAVRKGLLEDLRQFFDEYRHPRVVLTSRIVGYGEGGEPLPGGKKVELLGYEAQQSRAVAAIWFENDQEQMRSFQAAVQQQPDIRQFLLIPLFLNLVLRTHQYFRTRKEAAFPLSKAFPTRRVELYEHCLQGLLKLWVEEKKARKIGALNVKADLNRLAKAAYGLTRKGKELFDAVDFAYALGEEDDSAEDFVARMMNDGVLVELGPSMRFLHRTFQEYLTARYLANVATR